VQLVRLVQKAVVENAKLDVEVTDPHIQQDVEVNTVYIGRRAYFQCTH